MKQKKLLITIFALILNIQIDIHPNNNEQADLIVFSFDRPMQLHAFFESLEKHVKNINEVWVLYRCSSERFEESYQRCFKSFSKLNLKLVKQGNNNAEQTFKPLLMHCLRSTQNKYILFAVDDIIVKDNVDMTECIKYLEQTKAVGFYLRLGKNITECYTEGLKTDVPKYETLKNDVCLFSFKGHKGDWCYPYSIDMTLYNKDEIFNQIQNLNFNTPNRFEGNWHVNEWFYNQNAEKKGLFFEESKIVNIPLNVVQTECISRNMGLSSYNLLEKYEKGLKINIEPFHKILNKAPHIEFDVTFLSQFPFDELWNACKEKNIEKVNILKNKYSEFLKDISIFDIKDANGYTPLMWACNCEHVDAVKFILENKADVNMGDKNEFTALMYASWRGNIEIVDLLLKHKANIDAVDVNGTTALAMADRSPSSNKEKIIAMLIEGEL